MTSTLALLGFLALTFLVVSRALSAFRRRDNDAHKRQRGRLRANDRFTGKNFPLEGL